MEIKTVLHHVGGSADALIRTIQTAVSPFISTIEDLRITFVGAQPFTVEVAFKMTSGTLSKNLKAIESSLRVLEKELGSTGVTSPERKTSQFSHPPESQWHNRKISFQQFMQEHPDKNQEAAALPSPTLQEAPEKLNTRTDSHESVETRELAALSVKKNAIRCRDLHSGALLTFRPAGGGLFEVEGEILTVIPAKTWTFKRTSYISGTILSKRIDIEALKLTPLKLEPRGMWDPKIHYWGEPGEPVEECLKPILAKGSRPQFEMEHILPGGNENGCDYDPIYDAVELYDSGKRDEAHALIEKLLLADMRCIDAHVHLGNWIFNGVTDNFLIEQALLHYKVGCAIGELSLNAGFTGALPWGFIDNRPYLRSLHGYGLCLWRLGQIEQARELFTRLLWMNPVDNQGIRFLIESIDRGEAWEDLKE